MQRMQWINRPSLFSLSDKRLAPPQALRSTCQPPHHFHTLPTAHHALLRYPLHSRTKQRFIWMAPGLGKRDREKEPLT